MALTDLQTSRYSRQLAMPEIGPVGQERLLSSSVLIIGAGGLGSTAAYYLAAAGVGIIGIADNDIVDISNLQRQILHCTETLGSPKVESAATRLRLLNPDVKAVEHHLFVSESNIGELIAPYDFVIDCTDSIDTKYIINDACIQAVKPFCHGSAVRFYGQVMTVLPGRSPCCRCVFRPEDKVLEAKELGTAGAVAGVIGCLQAMEAIKFLTGSGKLLTGRLLTFDGLDMCFQTIPMKADPDCPVCGAATTKYEA